MTSPKPTCTGPPPTWCNLPTRHCNATPVTAKTAAWIGKPSAILAIPSNGAEGINRHDKAHTSSSLLDCSSRSLPSLGFAPFSRSLNLLPLDRHLPLHPTFALLDENGENVLNSGNPVSTMQTCGQCHDTEFIQSHAFHSDLGLSDYTEDGGLQRQHRDLRQMGSAHLSLPLSSKATNDST